MLLKSYEAKVGVESSQQAVWDLLCLYNGHRWGHLWLIGYQEQGRRDLTLETLRRRLTPASHSEHSPHSTREWKVTVNRTPAPKNAGCSTPNGA